MKAIRTMRKPSEPMLDMVLAMYTSMPWIIDITAISVVVARMIPSSVRKLRSLLPRRGICGDRWPLRGMTQFGPLQL